MVGENDACAGATDSDGACIGALFEAVAEEKLIQPVMIYDFPTAISPLSKRRLDDPSIAERFELYVAGMEIARHGLIADARVAQFLLRIVWIKPEHVQRHLPMDRDRLDALNDAGARAL